MVLDSNQLSAQLRSKCYTLVKTVESIHGINFSNDLQTSGRLALIFKTLLNTVRS